MTVLVQGAHTCSATDILALHDITNTARRSVQCTSFWKLHALPPCWQRTYTTADTLSTMQCIFEIFFNIQHGEVGKMFTTCIWSYSGTQMFLGAGTDTMFCWNLGFCRTMMFLVLKILRMIFLHGPVNFTSRAGCDMMATVTQSNNKSYFILLTICISIAWEQLGSFLWWDDRFEI